MTKILAVDDSASMRQMVLFTLQSAGYEVVEAVDGQQALDIAKGTTFDLVLSDVNMPVMDGKELIGMVSQGDLVKEMISYQKELIKELEAFVYW